MRLRLGFLCVFLFLLVACKEQEPVFFTTTGQQFQFSNYKGKWVFVNYWANWCRSCIEEIPELNKFYLENKNKVVVVGVDYDLLPKATLITLVKSLGIKYLVLVKNPSSYLKIESISVVPTTVVLDPEGKISRILYGPQTVDSLLKIIK